MSNFFRLRNKFFQSQENKINFLERPSSRWGLTWGSYSIWGSKITHRLHANGISNFCSSTVGRATAARFWVCCQNNVDHTDRKWMYWEMKLPRDFMSMKFRLFGTTIIKMGSNPRSIPNLRTKNYPGASCQWNFEFPF